MVSKNIEPDHLASFQEVAKPPGLFAGMKIIVINDHSHNTVEV